MERLEKALLETDILRVVNKRVAIANADAFDGLLHAMFSAWAYKALGRRNYHIRFVGLDADHYLLVVRRRDHAGLPPGHHEEGLYNGDFLTANGFPGLRGKLLYNADVAPCRSQIDIRELDTPTSVEALRQIIVERTLAAPEVYGWLFGGEACLLTVPVPVVEDMVAGVEESASVLCGLCEHLLCLRLVADTGATAGVCHIEDDQPFAYSEIDVLLYFASTESSARGLWKSASGMAVRDDIGSDRVFVLENSSGVRDAEGDRWASESESVWHPKVINSLALRAAGFERVKLHLCSLSPISLSNAAFDAALKGNPDFSTYSLGEDFIESVRAQSITLPGMQAKCEEFVQAALESARELAAGGLS